MTDVDEITTAPAAGRSFAHFRIAAPVVGGDPSALVEVNDQDITRNVKRAVLMMGAGSQVTTLQLELMGSGEIAGDGIVQVVLDADQAAVPLTQAVLRFLDSVDPIELEQRMLGGGMSEGPAVTLLAALKQMALG